MFNKQFKIGNRLIANGEPPYIIAELSGNHNGQYKRAIELIELAKKNGADAIKLQTYTADSITINSQNDEFQIKSGIWSGSNLYELYKNTSTPYNWFPGLFEKAKQVGLTIFSSPYDIDSVIFLEELDCPAYKIASNEFTDFMLIERVAQTKKPIILSTGTATLDEIYKTVNYLNELGCREYALLHCISAYPAPINEINLAVISELKKKFDIPVGLSDHTLGNIAAISAVVLGASIIEKHFTLKRTDAGPDSTFSIEPDELRVLCQECYDAFHALGSTKYGLKNIEKESPIFKRHFYSRIKINKGDAINLENIKSVRARRGIDAVNYKNVIGLRALGDISEDQPIEWDMLSKDV